MRILIAEDSRSARRLVEERVREWGYEPVIAEDGSAAWEILQRPDAPSIAILDWMMPGLDGPSICRLLRARGGEPYTWVLLLSGRDRQDDLLEGLRAGADDYLAKSFDDAEL